MPPSESPLTSCWRKRSKRLCDRNSRDGYALPALDLEERQDRRRGVAVRVEADLPDRRVEALRRGDVLQHVGAGRHLAAVVADRLLDRGDLDLRRRVRVRRVRADVAVEARLV